MTKNDKKGWVQKNLDALVKCYKKKACNISATCEEFGISRETFYRLKENDKDFAKKLLDAEESLLDYAESMLFKEISKGNFQAIKFILETKGRNRGYAKLLDINTKGLNIIVGDEKTAEALEDL